MRRLARPLPSAARVLLSSGWGLGRVAPGGSGSVLHWQPLPTLLPVAAALQRSGEWSLEGTPLDFDQGAWWYRCRFDLPAGSAPWLLGLDGLATLAEVSLNGQPLLVSRNMFRSHEVRLEHGLLEHGNELLIRFDPLQAALAERRPRPRWRVPMLAHQQLRWWRTTLLGRTPGWSLPAAVVGPWRPVWLEPAESLRVTELQLQADLIGRLGVLRVRLGLEGGEGAWKGARIRVERVEAASPVEVAGAGLAMPTGAEAAAAPGGLVAPPGGTSYQARLSAGEDGGYTARIELPQVARWWPHTHGEPALYQVSLIIEDGTPAGRKWPLGRVGFRRVFIDRSGDGFRIVVNDVPVFARGACWTPLDALRLHAGAAGYDAALAQLQAAGANMLRLSGAMVYEDDAFFDACDRHGVMVWQDLMFASMDYPAEDPAFIAEVNEELAQQLSRWQARPCLAVVCGNSEVEQQAALWGAPRELWAPTLFHEHLPAQVQAHLPGVPYWPSSAHGGAFPFQPGAGTASYYGIGAYRRELADARHSGLRFATECLGFAQVPTDTTLARLRELNGGLALRPNHPLWKARASRDLGAGYDFDDVRDHYVEQLFGERVDELRRHDPARHLMLGRAAAAEAITAAFNQWRAAGSACGGALVWFLRDLWAGAGWGLLDDQGLPKSGFHAFARACQPLHLGLTDDGLNGLHLHLVNERPQPRELLLELALYRDGETLVAQARSEVALAARATEARPVVQLLEGFNDWSWAYRFGPPPADLLVARCRDASGRVLAEQVHFIAGAEAGPARGPLRRAALGLSASAEALPDGRRRVTISSRAAARAVHLEAEGWQADDEFFNLAPGAERVLYCRPVAGWRKPWRATLQAINALAPVPVGEAVQ